MDDRRHRLYLWRSWSEAPEIMFVGLNPSTANETEDDPTVRRCVSFAKRWGYGTVFMCNAFTLVSPDPLVLKRLSRYETLYRGTDLTLRVIRRRCQQAIVMWGNSIILARDGERRAARVVEMLEPVKCFGLTQAGQPKHPLYLRKDAELERLDASQLGGGQT